jgi:hypothetical protein
MMMKTSFRALLGGALLLSGVAFGVHAANAPQPTVSIDVPGSPALMTKLKGATKGHPVKLTAAETKELLAGYAKPASTIGGCTWFTVCEPDDHGHMHCHQECL